MTFNEEIKELFKNFEVDGIQIPVEFIRYKGDKETFITFQEVSNTPIYNCDNECEYSIKQFDFDIYTKGNYLNILKAVKKKLKDNEWSWISDSADMYETDTKYYHKTATFEKEQYKE